MRLVDLLWYFPVAIAAALAIGASGRDRPREILRGAVRTFWTLLAVVGGTGVVIRVLVVVFT